MIGDRVFRLIGIVVFVVSVATAIPALAAIDVEFHPIPSGPDLDDATEFLGKELDPMDYDTRERHPYGSDGRRLSDRIDVFVQDWVIVGRYDINDDGAEEWFFFFEDWTFCGTAGCDVLIAQKRGHDFETLCEIKAHGPDVVITDRVTVNGFHELEAAGRVYWHGNQCIQIEDFENEEDERAWRAVIPPPDQLRPIEMTAADHDDGYDAIGKGPENRRALGRYRLPPVVLIDTGWRNLDGSWTAKAHKLSVQSERDFLSNPNAQEDALEDFLRATERRISAFGLLSYLGKKISGREGEIVVSEAGIMAAVHLMGASRTADYFRELDGVHAAGRKPFTDIDRAAIETRLSEFQNVPYQRLTRPSAARPRRGAR